MCHEHTKCCGALGSACLWLDHHLGHEALRRHVGVDHSCSTQTSCDQAFFLVNKSVVRPANTLTRAWVDEDDLHAVLAQRLVA